MWKKPIIAIRLRIYEYVAIISLADYILDKMTANPFFSSPFPTLAELSAAIAEAKAALLNWGVVGNRGSHSDVVTLRVKIQTLYDTLTSMAHYVQATAQQTAGADYATMTGIIVSSGFSLKHSPQPQGILEAVENFHAVISPELNMNQVKMIWKNPPNESSANVLKFFKMYKTEQAFGFNAATLCATTTEGLFIATNESSVTKTLNFWIVPVGAAGDGVVSAMLTVNVPGAQ